MKMNRQTGKAMDEQAHIEQSVGDILSTRTGTHNERKLRHGYDSACR